MDNSLLILQYIITRLKASDELAQLMDVSKMWATIAPEGTILPYIVLTRDAIDVQYTKDRLGFDNKVTFNVTVYGETYDQAIYIANAVRHSLEQVTYHDEDIWIHPIELINATEGITENYNYVQQLTFKCAIE